MAAEPPPSDLTLAQAEARLTACMADLEELKEDRLFSRMVFAVGALVIVAGATMITWMIILRFKTLKHTYGKYPSSGMLSHGEFIAGITGGCILIVTVMILGALWKQLSTVPTQTTL